MKRFAQLVVAIDRTNRTAEKVQLLREYFATVAPDDGAWALAFLSGQGVKRGVKTTLLRQWISELSGYPLWLVEECYDAVGDLAETLALLVSGSETSSPPTLATMVSEQLLPLRSMAPDAQRALLTATWQELSASECFVWNKLITGQFRIGVAQTLVVRALAEVAGIPPASMAHRLMGTWHPTAENFTALLASERDQSTDPARPYPFFLAHPIDGPPQSLGDVGEWQAEWKWDGIRAQLIRRNGQFLLWSRGEELLTERFPDLAPLAAAIPDGTVLDGEILAWKQNTPLPFNSLQTRIARKRLTAKILAESPAFFMTYDLLEHSAIDQRATPLAARREQLASLLQKLDPSLPLRISPLVEASSWDDLHAAYARSREENVEGLMLKRKSSPYGVGRTRGDWWKWKSQPLAIDAVLVYAQKGHGRRASLYTDYTFAVWHEGELVTMAKAYSGLTDAEIREVDAFVRKNTTGRFGPVRVVEPQLVFELHFEGVQPSSRHKAGLAVRFPRMARWRKDKQPADADTLETLRALAAQVARAEDSP